jgi:hypothetical protein
MEGNREVVAIDLEAWKRRDLPRFAQCKSLSFVRLPPHVDRVPMGCFEGCDSLVAVDLSRCKSLRAIGSDAFAGCRGLESVWMPNRVEQIQDGAFAWSGIRHFHAGGDGMDVDDWAFRGCLDMEEARFERVGRLGRGVFCSCEHLTSVTAEALEEADYETLLGTQVSIRIASRPRAEVLERLESVRIEHIAVMEQVWTEEAQPPLMTKTRLTVLGAWREVESSERGHLCEIDLSELTAVLGDMELNWCPYLTRAILPRGIASIPIGLFSGCHRLVDVNLKSCSNLVEIGVGAFNMCLSFREVDVPDGCRQIDFAGSGLRALDLRHLRPQTVNLVGCGLLKALVLPLRLGRELRAQFLASLSLLTIPQSPSPGVWRIFEGLRLRQARFVGFRYPRGRPTQGAPSAWVAKATVLAEVVTLSGRVSVPLPPV